jgi:hypothetical protein
MPVTPLIDRTAFSTRCFSSAEPTAPTIVTFPLLTKVLTSSFARAASAARAESMRAWIEASSDGAEISPPDTAGDGCAEGFVWGVGEMVADGRADGDVRAAAGTVCCGAREAVSGLNGRLVMKSARNVASPAAAMMLMAIHNSLVRDAAGGRRRLRCAGRCGDASTTMRLLDDRGSGTWLFPGAEIISYRRFVPLLYQMRQGGAASSRGASSTNSRRSAYGREKPNLFGGYDVYVN